MCHMISAKSLYVFLIVQEAFRAGCTSPFVQWIGCLTKVIHLLTYQLERRGSCAERNDDAFMLLN